MAYTKQFNKIIFKGSVGSPPNHLKVCTYPRMDEWNDINNNLFQAELVAFSDAKIVKTNAIYTIPYQLDPPGANVNIDKVLRVKVRNNSTTRVETLSVPAPKDSILDSFPGGQRLSSAALSAFQTLLDDYFFDNYSILYSSVEQIR